MEPSPVRSFFIFRGNVDGYVFYTASHTEPSPALTRRTVPCAMEFGYISVCRISICIALDIVPCTVSIPNFGHSVKFIVYIFYLEAISVLHIGDFSVIRVVGVVHQLIISCRDGVGVAEHIVGEGICCGIGGNGRKSVGGIVVVYYRPIGN